MEGIKLNSILKVFRIIFSAIGGIFCFVALISIIIALIINGGNKKFYDTSDVTSGKVESVDSNNTATIINYKVDGKLYKKRFSAKSSEVNSGNEVKVYYKSDNPNNAKIKEFSMIPCIILGIIGGVFLFIGIVSIAVINIICHIAKKSVNKNNYNYN